MQISYQLLAQSMAGTSETLSASVLLPLLPPQWEGLTGDSQLLELVLLARPCLNRETSASCQIMAPSWKCHSACLLEPRKDTAPAAAPQWKGTRSQAASRLMGAKWVHGAPRQLPRHPCASPKLKHKQLFAWRLLGSFPDGNFPKLR